ncbi:MULTISPECIES: hypothetical protein [Amycolatopsis]|uniref:Uncharacterized protein n=1 Tax=Amycolatopsis bullii TaxID=941987 RepID=A0ABQ3K975_9PSEU|nr:hypothetical protein [Amycolatopsis bullii]GHG08894.1 hypothetical protein GCM10017567_27160 [Amycolatopsis bullii]
MLNAQGVGKAAPVLVQPDALLHGQSRRVSLEAKRLRASSFQVEQLTREYPTVTPLAGARIPLLLLILGAPPPARVASHGRITMTDAIDQHSTPSTPGSRAPVGPYPPPRRLERSAAWITWTEFADVLHVQHQAAAFADASVAATETRMFNAVSQATHWHQ